MDRAQGPTLFDRVAARQKTLDAWLYPAFAAACVLYAATAFYGSMHEQTGGVWSAPLDDVFIHYDYARAAARGYPFQWSEGNGFSSGNTSLTYPFVLAFGYWIGFRGLAIGMWAAFVACASTLGFLLAVGSVSERLGPWAKYLVPPVVLSLGALDWTLFSGMENAFHLGMWGACLVATRAVERAKGDRGKALRRAVLLGFLGAILFATRPESVACVAAFGVVASLAVKRTLGARAAFVALVATGAPGALTLGVQAAANRFFTGEWEANGAIAKLALNNPYMTAREKWDQYAFLLKYVVLRNTEHHFADVSPWGWIIPAMAVLPLVSKTTRSIAVLLWFQVVAWLALVALNGQVRWQNERYTMAAVAFLLVLAALGLALLLRGLVTRAARGPAAFAFQLAKAGLGVAAAIAFARHQAPNMRDQTWFFGRASRNIHDQHVLAGQELSKLKPRRILVGDAGALLYASDRPGLDLIGLGGYKDLPFARASVHGLGASLELIERMPPQERPDVMAIYTSWWGDLPAAFGRYIGGFAVVGNVICGDTEKSIYRTDWTALADSDRPRSLKPGERVLDELDVADLVSERRHRYVFPHPSAGFVDFRVLPDPSRPKRDLFDAGRIIPRGLVETARVKPPSRGGRLVLRTIAPKGIEVEVRLDGTTIGKLSAPPAKTWSEPSLALPGGLPATVELTLAPLDGDLLDTHVWLVEEAPKEAVAGSAPGR